ncbi:energy-coupling factor transporter transmembrane component T family protein [Kocuria tytonis]|uniref:Energy-coupling factor transporter transmembrane protein EcfT n=1 Tax=Kocuria tytonis TaxID=2054280 RepID=A0A495A589_9MICC|nr:energy-coupling factor transporter transmembrane component T [Kocuria tytonis]RKQ34840.1 energy-coupling factor transporter transmembrane protein EcfT [Kocuria tytonis]
MSTTTAPTMFGPRSGLLARANPVVKLLGALLITLVIVLSADPVTNGVALAGQLVLLAGVGLGPWRLLTRLWPVVLAALVSGWGTAMLSDAGGPVLLHLGWITITTGSLGAGAAIALRGLAIALPGITVLLTTDPTDLADGLAQTLGLPARFVLAALAAMRLVEVMITEWSVLAAARRARGAGGGRGPWGVLVEFGGQAFTLLVQSLRRATRLAMTMEARGFGAGPRTWARTPHYGRVDVLVGVAVVAIAAGALAVSLALGTHRFIWQ